jgi:hypothetical protein
MGCGTREDGRSRFHRFHPSVTFSGTVANLVERHMTFIRVLRTTPLSCELRHKSGRVTLQTRGCR